MSQRERVAVIGAGLMGHGIAQLFAVAGHPVAITDVSNETLATVHDRVRSNLKRADADPTLADAIKPCESLERAVADAELVIEAAPENLDLKRRLFARLGKAAPAGAILASNTSVMSIGEIGRDAAHPGRVVGTHFWNPPYLIPLVEVTQAAETRIETVHRVMSILASAGKVPIHVRRDIPGFVGNRLQHALWREAISLVEHGVCDADAIDTVIKQSFGLRLPVLGPLENADLVGLDLTLAIHEYVLPHLERRPGPSPLLQELVASGKLGAKTGQGFGRWDADRIEATQQRLFAQLSESSSRQP
jgi:3-hydroxybutyryl-CoA dehydrogenase